MSSNDKEQKFIDGIKGQLDQSQQDMDPITLVRLKAARITALDSGKNNQGWFIQPKLWLATAMSVLITFTVLYVQKPEGENMSIEVLPMLTEVEDFELYQELEFYQWLEYERDQG